MKSLVRWSATTGLIGSVLIGTLFASATHVLALPQDQVLQKLRPIPVFTIANAQGYPLVATASNGQKEPSLSLAFINKADAQAFLDGLKTKDPKLASSVKVVPLSLAEVYQLNQSSKGKPDQAGFAFVPSSQQVTTAVNLLRQGGQQVNQFNVTPLFAIVSKKGNETGYVVFQRGNQKGIPMFFDKEQLQTFLDGLKSQQPDLVSNTQIQVLSLEYLIAQLQAPSSNADPKRDEFLSQIELVPSQNAIEFIRSLTPQQGNPKPAPADKK